MLKQLHLKNFKSFAADAEPIPFAPVTILVGANATGKSNVFDAMRFLQGLGQELSLDEIFAGRWKGGKLVYAGIRGGAKEACWGEESTFSLAVRTEMPRAPSSATRDPARKDGSSAKEPARADAARTLRHEISCRPLPEPAKIRESLESDGEIVRMEAEGDANLDESGSFVFLESDSRPEISFLVDFYADMRFLAVSPRHMKRYVPRVARELGERAENLSAVVHRICRDPEQKTSLLHWLSALCVPELTDITFDETKTGDVLVQLVEGGGTGRVISARSLSDGTLRFFGLLAAMFTAPEGSLFLLEEIENGLHPTRVHLLVQLLEQFAEFRNLQIIATTHSPQVLLSLSDDAMRDAVLFARHEEAVGTVVSRLGDLPYFEEVIQKTHIDQLFTTGWMEFAV